MRVYSVNEIKSIIRNCGDRDDRDDRDQEVLRVLVWVRSRYWEGLYSLGELEEIREIVGRLL